MKVLNLLRLLKYKGKTHGTAADRSKEIQSMRAEVINKSICRRGSILDVGCGGTRHTTFDLVCATGEYDLIVGIDAHKPSIQERIAWAKSRSDSERFKFIHSKAQDIKFDQQFEVILLSHVIEHLTLIGAHTLLDYLWTICSKQMVVETPNEFEDGRNAIAQYDNPHQEHKSLIDEAFMVSHGFKTIYTYSQDSGFSNSIYLKERT